MDRMFEYEYRPDGELTFRVRLPAITLLPEESRRHLRGAARELLLAVRSGLDDLLSRLEERPAEGAERPERQRSESSPRARRIPVE